MAYTRRKLISTSSKTLAGLSLATTMKPGILFAQSPTQTEAADRLISTEMRKGFPAELPLNPDGSAVEYDPSLAGPIEGPLKWRTPDRKTPTDLNPNFKDLKVTINTRGLSRISGTLRASDLEGLPKIEKTYLLQCGAPTPRGIVTWGGVRFSDFVDILGLHDGVHYCRTMGFDGAYGDEDMNTLKHPQVMLAWEMNGAPLPADHGAPLRLIIPFRYGRRSIKSITEMTFSTPSLPAPPA